MTDEIIKRAFASALTAPTEAAKQQLASSATRLKQLQERQIHIQELLPQVVSIVNDAIRRSKQVPPADLASFYEKELTTLCQGLTNLVTSNAEEISRLRGAVAASEALIKIYGDAPQLFDVELKKARDIQEKQAEGKLDKPRKLGQRPDKLKDVRNYKMPDPEE